MLNHTKTEWKQYSRQFKQKLKLGSNKTRHSEKVCVLVHQYLMLNLLRQVEVAKHICAMFWFHSGGVGLLGTCQLRTTSTWQFTILLRVGIQHPISSIPRSRGETAFLMVDIVSSVSSYMTASLPPPHLCEVSCQVYAGRSVTLLYCVRCPLRSVSLLYCVNEVATSERSSKSTLK